MRVLIFHGYMLRGTGSNIYNVNLAPALARLGHEVHLVCQDRDVKIPGVRIHNRSAALHAARLAPEEDVQVPDAPFLHLFVTRGQVDLEGCGRLGAGDAVRFRDGGGQRVTGAEEASTRASRATVKTLSRIPPTTHMKTPPSC